VTRTVTEVDGIAVQGCAELGPYTTYTNCTVYSNRFHNLCDARGVTCNSVTAYCNGADAGHAFNMVHLTGGVWCLVDSTGSTGGGPPRGLINPCFDDPANIPPAALCAAMGRPLEADGSCGCTTVRNSETPLPTNTNPVTSCALHPDLQGSAPSFDNFRRCETCCVNTARYYSSVGADFSERWQCECSAACWSHYHPYATGQGLSNPFRCQSLAEPPAPPPPAPLAYADARPAAPPAGAADNGCYVCVAPADGSPASWQWEAPCSL
jgi:hypothetical protein